MAPRGGGVLALLVLLGLATRKGADIDTSIRALPTGFPPGSGLPPEQLLGLFGDSTVFGGVGGGGGGGDGGTLAEADQLGSGLDADAGGTDLLAGTLAIEESVTFEITPSPAESIFPRPQERGLFSETILTPSLPVDPGPSEQELGLFPETILTPIEITPSVIVQEGMGAGGPVPGSPVAVSPAAAPTTILAPTQPVGPALVTAPTAEEASANGEVETPTTEGAAAPRPQERGLFS